MVIFYNPFKAHKTIIRRNLNACRIFCVVIQMGELLFIRCEAFLCSFLFYNMPFRSTKFDLRRRKVVCWHTSTRCSSFPSQGSSVNSSFRREATSIDCLCTSLRCVSMHVRMFDMTASSLSAYRSLFCQVSNSTFMLLINILYYWQNNNNLIINLLIERLWNADDGSNYVTSLNHHWVFIVIN